MVPRHAGLHASVLFLRVAILLGCFAAGAAAAGLSGDFQHVNPYEVLGLSRADAAPLDPKELKRAYRRAALRWHPDRAPAEQKAEAERRFLELSWAYETLSDPARRAAYDAGASAGASGGAGPRRDFSMEEAARIFREVFGKTSNAYRELVDHLARSAGSGDRETWQRHAEEIAAAMAKAGKGGEADQDFDVETRTASGDELARTSKRTVRNADGSTTRTLKTEHKVTRRTTTKDASGGQQRLHGQGAHGNLKATDPLAAHRRAHEQALEAARRAHAAAAASAAAAAAAAHASKALEL
eukprot:TRINITY_DN16510_c0_g2_i1.p2 TRINITY_DN16510_c0_g2~~TRINITY_DN16510_c0_g2_i1.p2  ORF type:complete len:298 (+),score=89.78 TRINITY_DN16510_c0_g2_i1:232-1125(+)